MTFSEFSKIAIFIKTAYPNSTILPDDASMIFWHKMLKDLDFMLCENAVLEHINTSVFPPSIAEIREQCTKRMINIPDWGEAWGEIELAIRRYGYPRESEALDSLSELTREAVRRLGWQNICMSENVVADRAHFSKIYDSLAKRTATDKQMPDFVFQEKQQLLEKNKAPVISAAEVNQITEGDIELASQEHIGVLMARLRRREGA